MIFFCIHHLTDYLSQLACANLAVSCTDGLLSMVKGFHFHRQEAFASLKHHSLPNQWNFMSDPRQSRGIMISFK